MRTTKKHNCPTDQHNDQFKNNIFNVLHSFSMKISCITPQNRPRHILHAPTTVAEQCEAQTVFSRSNAGIVGSNPTQSHGCICVFFYVFVVVCVARGLATG
jgi:hypothetical protein